MCMDRQRRVASTKVADFRQYHLSGELDKTVEGLVDNRITQFEMATVEKLQQKLEEERAQSKKMQEEAEIAHIQNELEVERLKQQQWQTALDKLKEARAQVEQEHEKCMAQMEETQIPHRKATGNNSLEWLQAQMSRFAMEPDNTSPPLVELEKRAKDRLEKEAAILELKKQQAEIGRNWQS